MWTHHSPITSLAPTCRLDPLRPSVAVEEAAQPLVALDTESHTLLMIFNKEVPRTACFGRS